MQFLKRVYFSFKCPVFIVLTFNFTKATSSGVGDIIFMHAAVLTGNDLPFQKTSIYTKITIWPCVTFYLVLYVISGK